MTLRRSKIELPPRRQLDFWKIGVFDPKMVLRAPGGSLGLVLGALGGFLGTLLVVLGASWELQVATKLLSK